MAVFTEVGVDEAAALTDRLDLGTLTELRGIEGGIENTNYFLTTDAGEFVLTLFERLGAEQWPDDLGAGLAVTEETRQRQRSLSFGAEAAAYERGRPSYPPEAIDWLLPAVRTTCSTSARAPAS